MVSTSLWANIPHYVAQTPSPKGALAIVKKLQLLLDLELDLSDLESATRDYQVQIDKVIASDEDAQAYVAVGSSRDSPCKKVVEHASTQWLLNACTSRN